MPSHPRRRMIGRVFAGLAVILVTAVFAAMTIDFIWGGRTGHQLTTLDPKGSYSDSIQKLVTPVFAIAMVIGVLVIGGIGFIAFKFRERDGDDGDEFPNQRHGHTSLEIGWTLLPALILAGVGRRHRPDPGRPRTSPSRRRSRSRSTASSGGGASTTTSTATATTPATATSPPPPSW